MENPLTTKNKIVLIPFPFDTLNATKVRPALCLTDPIGPHRHIILAFISSRLPDNLLESDLVIDSNGEDFTITGLRVSSTLRLHRLMTVTASLIKRKLGELSPALQKKVLNKLKKVFGLAAEEPTAVTPEQETTTNEHPQTQKQED